MTNTMCHRSHQELKKMLPTKSLNAGEDSAEFGDLLIKKENGVHPWEREW